MSSFRISCQDTSPCSRVHSSPVYKDCCSLLPPSHVHRHTVQSLGHMSCYFDIHTHCYNPSHSVPEDSVSHTGPHPSLAYTDMHQSQGHSQYCCHHDSCTRGCTPVQTILTHISAHTTHPCSPVHKCMSHSGGCTLRC